MDKQNTKSGKLQLLAAFSAGIFAAAVLLPATASAFDLDLGKILGKAIKVVGIKAAVDEFGDEIDKGINKVLENNDAETGAYTKVVTIVSPIGNKHIGAAQVVGPKEAVEKVGVVAQIETSFMDKMFRAKVLVPIEGKDANEIKRVPGVGVSAVIDVKI